MRSSGYLSLFALFLIVVGNDSRAVAQVIDNNKTTQPAAQNDELLVPAPTGLELAAATKKAQDAFKRKAGANDDKLKAQAVQELLEMGSDKSAPAPERYASLYEAALQAAKLKDTEGISKGVNALLGQFRTNPTPLLLNAQQLFIQAGGEPEKLCLELGKLADAAATRGNAEQVNTLKSLALTLSARLENKALGKAMRAQLDGLAAKLAVYPARITLFQDAQDKKANYELGWYCAAFEDDWATALPMLAKGSDDNLKAIAEKELANPKNSEEMFALAELYWALADKIRVPRESEALRRHAGAWHLKALPNALPGNITTIKTRLATTDTLISPQDIIAEMTKPKDERGLKLEWFSDQGFKNKLGERVDYKVSARYGNGVPGLGATPNRFAVRWSGFLVPPAPGKYKFQVDSSHYRLKIAGQMVLDGWGFDSAGMRKSNFIELTNEPVEIVMEGDMGVQRFWSGPKHMQMKYFVNGVGHGSMPEPNMLFLTKAAALKAKDTRPTGKGLACVSTSTGNGLELKRFVLDNLDYHDWSGASWAKDLNGGFQVEAKGYILIDEPGPWIFTCEFTGKVEMTIDGKQILKESVETSDPYSVTSAKAGLQSGVHEITVINAYNGRYNSYTGCSLQWNKEGMGCPQVIPASAFFVDRDAAQKAYAIKAYGAKK